MIPEATVDRIREAIDIVEVISGYVPLKKRGQNFIGLCPFHSEKTPSFNVNPARQIYHCFGCGRGGNVYKFLMEHERMGFVEAVKMLAERAHVEIPRDSRRSDDPTDRIYEANALALEFFRKALRHDQVGRPAREYLAKRRIGEELQSEFVIGYAPDRRRGLIQYGERRQVNLRDLEAAGLVYTDAARSADRFVQRLIFPVRNLSGKAIAFGGRDLTGEARAKYLNSPETAVYQKGRVLYGLYEARKTIQENKEAIVCEGYIDLIRLYEHGFTNVVAASGTAFTPEQARLLSRYAERALLLFDADGPGMAAALRSVGVLYDAGLDVLIVAVEKGEDPDTFLLKHGADAMRERIAHAQMYVEFLEQRAGGAFASLPPGKQNRLIGELAETIAHISDPVRRDLVTRSAWSQFGISEDHFRQRLAKSAPLGATTKAPASGAPPKLEGWKAELLQILVTHPETRPAIAEIISPQEFDSALHRRLLGALFNPKFIAMDPADLMKVDFDDELVRLLRDIASRESPFTGPELDDYVRRTHRARLQDEAARLRGELSQAERRGDNEAASDIAEQHAQVAGKLAALTKEPRRK
jgi:DNA primase